MNFDPKALLYAIRSSFWFIPSLLAIASIFLAIQVASYEVAPTKNHIPFLPNAGIPLASARLVLSTIAGSMITVASLVFSMTLIALSLISQQLGPRVLLRFMDDRPTQIVMGLFIATFLFSVIVLFRIDNNAVSGRVPGLSVLSSAGLAFISLGMMIHFVHHTANRIQADVLIAALGNDLNASSQSLISSHDRSFEIADADEIAEFDKQFDGKSAQAICAASSGYLSGFDVVTACRLGHEHGLHFKARSRLGSFVLEGTPVLDVSGIDASDDNFEELSQQIQNLLRLNQRRTPEASIEFELNALVEVALRALSPGVNDPYTAMASIDRLSDGLRILMKQKSPYRVSRDTDDDIRFAFMPAPFERYLEVALAAIIEMAEGNTLVMKKIDETLTALHQTASAEHTRKAIAAVQEGLDDRATDA